jgi:uncharacterized protein (DUF2252 family)
MRDPVVEFQNFNRAFARRNPELLRLKVARMAASPFGFFRGSFHLFARDSLDGLCELPAPESWSGLELDLVGDIHSENFGTFDGADDCVHYDINDFDETTHGRFDFDVRRQTTSVILACQERGDPLSDATQAAVAFVSHYTDTVTRLLKKGRDLAYDVSEQSPSGSAAVDRLVRTAAASRRPPFIEKLTTYANGHRSLVRSTHYFSLPEDERQQALRLLEDYHKRLPSPGKSGFYEPEDVCGRVSGIGSMGRLRYVVLVGGKGSKEARNRLIEFKEARPSAYDLYRGRDNDAAALLDRANRVIAMQRASQASSNPQLGFALDGGQSFQVRELGPHDMRLDWKTFKGAAEVQDAARAQAGILARAHSRAAARVVGVANPLAEFRDPAAFCQRKLAFALSYADLTRQDWNRFVGHRAELEQCEHWAGS